MVQIDGGLKNGVELLLVLSLKIHEVLFIVTLVVWVELHQSVWSRLVRGLLTRSLQNDVDTSTF